jgi:polar amino acid transport system substrate-binding protein
MVTAFNVRLRRAVRAALGASAALVIVGILATPVMAQGTAPAAVAKPAQAAIPQPAAPQAVPGFWDPRRRPERPD